MSGPVSGYQLAQVGSRVGDAAAMESCKISGNLGKVAVFAASSRGWGASAKWCHITSHSLPVWAQEVWLRTCPWSLTPVVPSRGPSTCVLAGNWLPVDTIRPRIATHDLRVDELSPPACPRFFGPTPYKSLFDIDISCDSFASTSCAARINSSRFATRISNLSAIDPTTILSRDGT